MLLSTDEIKSIAHSWDGLVTVKNGILKVSFKGPSAGVNLALFRSALKDTGKWSTCTVEWKRGAHKKVVVTFL